MAMSLWALHWSKNCRKIRYSEGILGGKLLGGSRKTRKLPEGGLSRINQDADFAASGDGKSFINASEVSSDIFQVGKALDVVLDRIATGTRPAFMASSRAADGPRA